MIDPTTQRALKARIRTSQCALAREMDEPVATISDIIALRHDHVSLRAENRIRRKLGLDELRPPLELRPNERLIRLAPEHKRDKRRCWHVSQTLHARLMRQRGQRTQEEFLSLLADMYEERHGTE